jgi:hypothetical protein
MCSVFEALSSSKISAFSVDLVSGAFEAGEGGESAGTASLGTFAGRGERSKAVSGTENTNRVM